MKATDGVSESKQPRARRFSTVGLLVGTLFFAVSLTPSLRISVSRNSEIQTPEGFGAGDPGSNVVAECGSHAGVARG